MTGAQFKGTILMDADLKNADFEEVFLRSGFSRNGNYRRKRGRRGLRGALGLSAEQVCSTNGWQAAQFDADVLAQTRGLCGAGH